MSVRIHDRGPLGAGERDYLDALVREASPRLFAYVRRVFGRSDEVEDIVAETFCRAASNLAALRGGDRPMLYLLTIARNLCRDRFRRQKPVDNAAADRLAEHPAQPSASSGGLAGNEQVERLQTAVAALPENLREIVVLRMSGDLKFEEIAELLHIPLGTAPLSRMHTAMGKLRQTMSVAHEH